MQPKKWAPLQPWARKHAARLLHGHLGPEVQQQLQPQPQPWSQRKPTAQPQAGRLHAKPPPAAHGVAGSPSSGAAACPGPASGRAVQTTLLAAALSRDRPRAPESAVWVKQDERACGLPGADADGRVALRGLVPRNCAESAGGPAAGAAGAVAMAAALKATAAAVRAATTAVQAVAAEAWPRFRPLAPTLPPA